MRKFLFVLFLVGLTGWLSSCATGPKSPRGPAGPSTATTPGSSGPRGDAIHMVGPGETFWRIAKMYDVPLATIMKANGISDPKDLKMGQRLKVPNAANIKAVVSLFPSDKWKYLIIHHSATEEGSSLQFHHSHLAKGWDKGVGYHFVIDNRTSGKQDGEIEATPRWIKQLDGAHCKASDMNSKAVGICLVGNFSEDKVSKKQMDSLVFLVETLRKYYGIPVKNIIAHGHVSGSSTDCPGKRFPWEDFKRRIR